MSCRLTKNRMSCDIDISKQRINELETIDKDVIEDIKKRQKLLNYLWNEVSITPEDLKKDNGKIMYEKFVDAIIKCQIKK